MSAANIYTSNGTKPRTQHPGKWWVRIKPYSPNTGAVVRSYTLRKLGALGSYKEADGWYVRKLNRQQVQMLLSAHVNAHDNSTPCVFDVCTFEEAHALDVQAKVKVKAAGGRRDAADAFESSSFSTRDLPSRELAAPARDDGREVMAERREQQDPPDDFDIEEDDPELDFDDDDPED